MATHPDVDEGRPMPTRMIVTLGTPEAADLSLADAEALGDFEADLKVLFASRPSVVVDLVVSPNPGEGISLPEAARAVVRAARAGVGHAELFVRTEVAREKVEGIINVGDVPPANVVVAGLPVRLLVGDITAVVADAITNASNTNLHLGSGVSGAIRRAASSSLQRELDAIVARGPIAPGGVVVTTSHGLRNARYIVHAATADGSVDSVAAGYAGALAACRAHHIGSLVVPALGTGVGGLAVEVCAQVLRAAIEGRTDQEWPRTLTIALWSAADQTTFVHAFSVAPSSRPSGAGS